MATQITSTNLHNPDYIFSSRVADIKASTWKDKVNVSLTCRNGAGGNPETFYSTTLYAFNGTVEFTDIGSLIEGYYRLRGKVAESIIVRIDDASVEGPVVYCEYDMPDDADPKDMLFLTTKEQRVHQDSIVTFASNWKGSTEAFRIRAVGHESGSDALSVVEFSERLTVEAVFAVQFLVSKIIQRALAQPGGAAGGPLRDVLYFSIEYGGHQRLCYVVPAPAYLTFSFRNIFNIEEYADVAGTITTKTEVSRDTALCKGTLIPYDRTVTRLYHVDSEPLTPGDVPIFEQLLASHDVKLHIDGAAWNVVITDHTCEPSSDDESLTVVKFTWRFARNRPRAFSSRFDGVMPTRRQIFNDSFSPEYE